MAENGVPNYRECKLSKAELTDFDCTLHFVKFFFPELMLLIDIWKIENDISGMTFNALYKYM